VTEKSIRVAESVVTRWGPYAYLPFWAITATQFLGAFNDNLYKQILLLLFLIKEDDQTRDLQWLATLSFSLPFVLFSGYAGYLSDRYSKRTVIVLSKVAEIVIMAMGIVAFAITRREGMVAWVIASLCFTIFLMGAQSTFFGPGKYGILPEFLAERLLPTANGFMLMTTFLAIILGSAVAGTLKEYFSDQLWKAGVVCTGIAVLGTITSLGVARVRAAQKDLPFDWSCIAIPQPLLEFFRQDRAAWGAVFISSVFWMAASMAQMAVNALGKSQLKVGEQRTSFLVASISIGIAAGSIAGGILSRQQFSRKVLATGLWGMVVGLLLLALPANNAQRHALGYFGSLIMLIVIGAFTGMFAVPLQVFLQMRPPRKLKGRMIATQNLLNWIGILASSPLYFAGLVVLSQFHWPPCVMFFFIASIMTAVGVYMHVGWMYTLRDIVPTYVNSKTSADELQFHERDG
jgi:MFS family permease